MKITWKGNDISDLVNTVTWSGSAYSSARSLEFALPNPAGDPNVKTPNIKTGDLICFYDSSKKKFHGKVTKIARRIFPAGNENVQLSKDLYSVTVFKYVSGSPFKIRSAYSKGAL